MVPRFSGVPTPHAIRPLTPAPPAVVLPILLTNIHPELFHPPFILTNLADSDSLPTSRPVPRPAPNATRTPHTSRNANGQASQAPRPTHPTREDSPLTPLTESDDEDVDGFFAASADGDSIVKTGNTIPHVVSLFEKTLYPELSPQERHEKYTTFRARIDQLAALHLDAARALSHQDAASLKRVYKTLSQEFPWLARCPRRWPAALCLQNKLHNSAARNMDKQNKKIIAIVQGKPIPKSRSRKRRTN